MIKNDRISKLWSIRRIGAKSTYDTSLHSVMQMVGFCILVSRMQGNVGVDDSRKLLELLPNLINQKTGILPFVELQKQNDKEYIIITVEDFSVDLYHGHYYMRSGSMTTALHGNQLSDFLLRKSGRTWMCLIPTTYTGLNTILKLLNISKGFQSTDYQMQLMKIIAIKFYISSI